MTSRLLILLQRLQLNPTLNTRHSTTPPSRARHILPLPLLKSLPHKPRSLRIAHLLIRVPQPLLTGPRLHPIQERLRRRALQQVLIQAGGSRRVKVAVAAVFA